MLGWAETPDAIIALVGPAIPAVDDGFALLTSSSLPTGKRRTALAPKLSAGTVKPRSTAFWDRPEAGKCEHSMAPLGRAM